MAAMATMVNMNNLLNGKDSRWLQLEVCREFQRNKCSRPDTECKFAHPPATVEVQNGRVTACYDSIKGRCNREKPPCKYFHPPQHLKDQLLINGRNHLALKNALMQQMGLTPGQVLPGQVPAVVGGVGGAGAAASHLAALDPISLALLAPQATSPYLSGVPGVGSTYAQYYAPQLVPAVLGHDPAAAAASPLGVMQQPVLQQKLPRTDRLETAAAAQQPTASATSEPGKKRPAPTELEPPPMDMKSVGSFYYDNFAFPGVVPYKRPAADKAGVPVYQPATTYQQLMQLQQPFVPVSCEYPAPATSAPPTASVPSSAAPPPSAAASAPSAAAPTPQPPAPAPPAPSPPADPGTPDPAAMAKEVAQKNYVAALAFAAQHSAMAQAAAAYTQQALKAQARAGMQHAGLVRAPHMMVRPGWAPPMPVPYYQQPFMYAVPPPAPPSAAAAAAAAAAAVNPYKKMKTT
ncbi:muscleblind-like protein isoform X1 [Spodoptera litura]|uniref:Muscleblind-like protein isoform X1 n=1 Tax=Spodoptera litura TaxID=69820 RepID=A0A9J7DYR3_SPOLT|nr:muscleblind-like protein isoform X1 [Spodoptera litura]XP_022821138.1 muscleblind-like protein isoform X1 [Spodoptera litura]XP_022821139.1 muscleblind-like protein isoform X1 [Spodoptera litura]XP_022821140.1 muscleblind-like protein isoform X1 [Spodoptera litura]